jgi:protein-disulfide isomerase
MKTNRACTRHIIFALTAVLVALMPFAASAQDRCLPVTDVTKRTLSQYVHKKFKLPQTLSVSVVEVAAIENTCYRKVRFEGSDPNRPLEFELFLSPDRRFLSRDLSDSQLDPIVEEQRRAERLQRGLLSANAPSLGPKEAAINVVVFSDFECAFCKNAARIMRQVASSEGKNLRFTFRHLPLRMHRWARTAAEATACAQLQNGDAFWKLHDQIFDNQSALVVENAKSKILEYARTIPELDVGKLQECLANRSASAIVSEDMRFASANEIAGTPTFFVNGHRVQGIRNAEQLIAVIHERMEKEKSGKTGSQ